MVSFGLHRFFYTTSRYSTRTGHVAADSSCDWYRTIPAGAVLATAILAGMARVGHINPLTGHAVHDLATETGCAVGLGQTRIDP